MNKKYCQNPLCYAKTTQDRLKGSKGSKQYQNRVINHNHYYGCCTQQCLNDFLEININRIINYIGALTDTPTRPHQQYITRNEYVSMRSNLRDRQ